MINFDLESLFFVLFILLLLSAFFSGAETSLMSVNRYKLKHKHKLGDNSANKVNFLVTNPEKTLGLILLLNNFVNILLRYYDSIIKKRGTNTIANKDIKLKIISLRKYLKNIKTVVY